MLFRTLLSEGCLYVEPRKGLTGINISGLSLTLWAECRCDFVQVLINFLYLVFV